MRFALLVILLTGIVLPAFSQYATDYRYGYGGAGNDFGRSIAAHGRNAYFIWGVSNSENTAGNNAVLIQSDSAGHLRTYKEFTTSGGNQEGYSMQLVDTSLYLMGTTNAGGSGTDKIFFMKTRLDGTPIWQRYFETGQSRTYPFSLRQMPNGDWLITTTHNFTQAELYRLDPNGNMIWRKRLSASLSQFYCVRPTADGNIAVCGLVGSNAYMAKLDNDGNKLWDVSFGQGNLHSAKSFVELPGGDFFINGYTNRGTRDVMLARVSSAGSLTWVKYFDRDNLGDVNYGSYLDRDSNVIVTGYTYHENGPANNIDYVMAKFDADGAKIWGKALSGANDDYVDNGPDHVLAIGPDEYIAMGGSASQGTGANGVDFVLFRFRQSTNSGCFSSDYNLLPKSLSPAIGSSPGYSFDSQALLPAAGVALSISDHGICKRIACRPENVVWDSLGADRTICTNSPDYPAVLDAGNLGAHYLWNTGDTTRTIRTAVPGVYSVQVQSGCGFFQDSVRISFVSPPTVQPAITAGGPLRFCRGGSVRLRTPPPPLGSQIRWTGGSTDTAITVTATGNYVVRYYNAGGCYLQSALVSVVVDPIPATPVIDTAGLGSTCGDTAARLRLIGGPKGNTVLWSNGVQDSVLTIHTPGSYTATVSTAGGCTATSAPVTVAFKRAPAAPAITANGPLGFCPGGRVVLRASGVLPQDTLRWSNGSTADSIVITTAGMYSASVTTAEGCRAVSVTDTVSAYPKPARPAINERGPVNFCEGLSVKLRVVIPAGDTLRWAPTGADSSRAGLWDYVVSASGIYRAVLINEFGCASDTSLPVTVTVEPLPARPAIRTSGPLSFCQGESVTLYADSILPGSRPFWFYGGSVIAADSLTASLASGTDTLRAVSAAGCRSIPVTVQITVNPVPPVPSISASGPTTFCGGGQVRLHISGQQPGDSLVWTNGASDTAITVTASGSYGVRVINGFGCHADGLPIAVTVNRQPDAPLLVSRTPLAVCQGNAVRLRALGVAPDETIRWPDGSSDSIYVAVETATGLAYTVTTPQGCSATSNAVDVTILPLPAAVISTSGPTAFCEGGQVRLHVAGLQPTDSVLWTTGVRDTVLTVTTSGNYGVRVTNSFGCHADAPVIGVTVNPLPDTPAIAIIGPTTFCAGGQVALATAVAPGEHLLWNTGDTTTGISITRSGRYSLVAFTDSGCRRASDTVTVRVLPAPAVPVVMAGGPTAFCAGDSVRLQIAGLLPGDSATWTTGQTGPAITVSDSGSFGVTVRNTVGCASASFPIRVTVYRQPVRPMLRTSMIGPLCASPGLDLFLDTVATGDRILWTSGDTIPFIGVHAAGDYSALVTTPEGCQVWSDTITVHPNPTQPTIVPQGPTSFCQPGRVRLDILPVLLPNHEQIQWINGPADSLGIWVDTSGAFQVEVTNSFGCKALSASTVVTALPAATIQLDSSGPLRFCAPGQVRLRLRGIPPGGVVRWSDGSSDSTLTAAQSGSYSAIVQNANGCLSRSDTAEIISLPQPPKPGIAASGPDRLCYGQRLDLTATGLQQGLRLLWSTGVRDSLHIQADNTNGYWLAVTNAAGCSATSDTLAVRFYDPTLPTLILAISKVLPCVGDSVVLVADGPDPIRWNTGYVGRRLVAQASGTFIAQAGGTNTCLLPVSDTARVAIFPYPTIEAGPDQDLCDGDTARIGSPAEPGVSYRWMPATHLPSDTVAQQIWLAHNDDPGQAPQTTRYRYTASYPGSGCVSTDSVTITLHSQYELKSDGSPYCDRAPLLIPNLITPNGDGENDAFKITALEFYKESSLTVYNRYGREVYSQAPYTNAWSGQGLPAGVYYYRLTVPKPGWEIKGWVELAK